MTSVALTNTGGISEGSRFGSWLAAAAAACASAARPQHLATIHTHRLRSGRAAVRLCSGLARQLPPPEKRPDVHRPLFHELGRGQPAPHTQQSTHYPRLHELQASTNTRAFL